MNSIELSSFISFSSELLLMLILATWSQASHSWFPLFDVDHLEIANCSNLTIVFYPLGNFGQALCIRSCHEELILTRKSHNCAWNAIIQGDSGGGSVNWTNFNKRVKISGRPPGGTVSAMPQWYQLYLFLAPSRVWGMPENDVQRQFLC